MQHIHKVFVFLMLILWSVSLFYIYKLSDKQSDIIRSDGQGYYAYLPALFDYKDLTFQTMPDIQGVYQDDDGNFINKYPIGVAILQTPFFIVTDIFYKIFTPELADGFSIGYQISSAIATLFYFFVGIWALWKILIKKFTAKIVYLTTGSMIFGTNLFHYLTYDACFSHIYSFCLITLFVLLTIALEESSTNKKMSRLRSGGVFLIGTFGRTNF